MMPPASKAIWWRRCDDFLLAPKCPDEVPQVTRQKSFAYRKNGDWNEVFGETGPLIFAQKL